MFIGFLINYIAMPLNYKSEAGTAGVPTLQYMPYG